MTLSLASLLSINNEICGDEFAESGDTKKAHRQDPPKAAKLFVLQANAVNFRLDGR